MLYSFNCKCFFVLGGNNNISDFLAISLEGGFIKVGVSFGWDPVMIYMNKGPKLNNMRWHHVDVSHKGKVIIAFLP